MADESTEILEVGAQTGSDASYQELLEDAKRLWRALAQHSHSGADSRILFGPFRSRNYRVGVSGWQISENGNVQFNDGQFYGNFTIGGVQTSVDDVADLQGAIDNVEAQGGGVVYIKDGVYKLTESIRIPSGVTVSGVNRDATIIDCNGAYSIGAVGSNPYNAGTITINTGDAIVTGNSTAFTSSMVGQFILLGTNGFYDWYEIVGYSSPTSLNISPEYTGSDLASQPYYIATVVLNPILKRLTVTNATTTGVFFEYTLEPIIEDVVVYSCGTGIQINQTVFPWIIGTFVSNGVNANFSNTSGLKIDFSEFGDALTGAGLTFNSVGNGTIIDTSIDGNAGNGIELTNCSRLALLSVTLNGNGDNGLELISVCDNMKFTDLDVVDNINDGFVYTATSDSNTITSCSFQNNGNYGVGIAAATCDNNIISTSQFSGNGVGAVGNSGTSTLIRSNRGVADN